MKKLIFLTPVFNDWDNLNILIQKIEKNIEKFNFLFELIIVNDCSSQIKKVKFNQKKICNIEILNLNENVGSQRAIALGLRFISEKFENHDRIIIIDSDGQDNPKIIPEIINISEKNPNEIITINRIKRAEPLWFRVLYELHYYSLIALTGKKIRFGNFSLLSVKNTKSFIQKGDLWGAYPAAVTNSFKNTLKIFKDRDKRYSGETKMNISKLFIHSVRVFSVFKFKVLIFSLIYSFIFVLLSFFVEEFFFIFLYFFIILNFVTFFVSKDYKKDFDNFFYQIFDKDI